jgi:hypothetical protein
MVLRHLTLIAVLLAALLLVGCESVGPLQTLRECERPSEHIKLAGGPLSAEGAEALNATEWGLTPESAREKPFGSLTTEWRVLTSQMKPGDAFYLYGGKYTPAKGTPMGFALVRGECIIGTIRTSYARLAQD